MCVSAVCLLANTLAAASLGSTLRKRFVLIFIIFSRFLTHVFLKKTFHSKVIVSFTYHKLTAIATTLLLRPVDLLLTAYKLCWLPFKASGTLKAT